MEKLSQLIQDVFRLCSTYWPVYLSGMKNTVILALVGTALGCLIGFVCGILNTLPIDPNDSIWRRGLIRTVRGLVRVYVELFRGTPMVLQAVFIYYAVRGGIISVDPGQVEGALAIGLSHVQAMTYVILPQAIRSILPQIGNNFIINLKDTSVMFMISFTDFFALDGHRAGHAGNKVVTLHFHRQFFIERACRTNLNLDLFGSAFAHLQVVHRTEVAHNRIVHLVTAHAHGSVADRTVQSDNSDVRSSATDIHNHVTDGIFDRNAHTNGRGHRFMNEVYFLRTRLTSRINHGALFHFGNAARHADHHARFHHPQRVLLHTLDECLEERFHQFKIGNHAIAHGAHGAGFTRSTSQHLLRLETDGTDTVVLAIHRNHRGLVNHYTLAGDVDQRIRRTKIYTNIAREKTKQNIALF